MSCFLRQSTDSHEVMNPLLDMVEHLENGVIILSGNMTLISLNLACKYIIGIDYIIIIIKSFSIELIPAWRIDALYKTYNKCINKHKYKLI